MVGLVRFVSSMLLMLVVGCRDHDLNDGTYALRTAAVQRDDCGLAVMGPFANGTLRTEGHTVSFTLVEPALRLNGSYRYGEEAFFVDGSLVNPTLTIGGRACLVDSAAWHLDATTVDPARFDGRLSVETRSEQNTACVCALWVDVTGQRTGD